MHGKTPFEAEHPIRILQSIVETAIDGIFLIDTEGIILMGNAAGHKLFGYEPGELVGKNIYLLMPSPHRKHIGTRFFRASNVSHLQGTGLGLNIVMSYLHFLKGNITFNSHEKGTTFLLTIPAEHEK